MDTDRKLADQMSTYWVNFAKKGDPNGPGLPKWPAYTLRDERALRLGEAVQPIPNPDGPQLDFLDQYNAKVK